MAIIPDLAGPLTPANLLDYVNASMRAVNVSAGTLVAPVNAQTGTVYTIQGSDNNAVVTLNNAGAVTVTMPNSLAVGFTCLLVQLGAGQVTVAAGSGAVINNRAGQSKIAGQYGVASVAVYANAGGAAAVAVLAGDTA